MHMNKINYLLLLIFLIPVSLFAQNVHVRGVIRDSATGNPMSGVTVELRNLQGKVAGSGASNANGEYNIQSTGAATTIAFSYVGMETVVENIDSRPEITVFLSTKATAIN